MATITAFRSLRRQLRRWIPGQRPALEYVPEGWNRLARDPSIKGWDVRSVSEAQAARLTDWRSTVRGNGPLSQRVGTQNTFVAFAYAAALASWNGKLSLLDWGGGLGQYGDLARGVLPNVAVDYFCKDVPTQCELGRQLTPAATFFESDDEFAGRRFDLVLASGALQYVREWELALGRLAAATGRYLFVTRLPVVVDGRSYVVLQRAYQYGYDTEFLGWRVNRVEFLAVAERIGLKLVREFVLDEDEWADRAPHPAHGRGYLFRP
jgi:putative methyltransferase (TIGR04325 family)